MRALLFSIWAYFISFFVWFSIAPLLAEIKDKLNLTKLAIWDSSRIGVFGTIASRVLIGPLCDRFGARVCLLIVLVFVSIFTALTGLINGYDSLVAMRFFIGFAGSVFVM